jgi:uncharacterized protein
LDEVTEGCRRAPDTREPEPARLTRADDAAVVRFLREHPDFFAGHRELTEQLELPHDCGQAISLLQYQSRLLRQRAKALEGRLDQIVGIARGNERIADQLHQFTLGLIGCEDLDGVLDTIADGLRKFFQIEFTAIRLQGRHLPHHRLEVCRHDEPGFVLLREMLCEQRPRCGLLPDTHRRFLFGETATRIRSTAVVPLRVDDGCGLIAIGSSDRNRYDPGNGTVFLRRLGDVCDQALAGLR